MVWEAIKAAQVKDAGRNVAVYRDARDGLLDVEVGVEVGTAFPRRDEVVGPLRLGGTRRRLRILERTADLAKHTRRFGIGSPRRT